MKRRKKTDPIQKASIKRHLRAQAPIVWSSYSTEFAVKKYIYIHNIERQMQIID